MNDDAVERWKETRAPRLSTSGWMTYYERQRDAVLLAAGVCQADRTAARKSFATMYAALRAVRS